MIRATAGVWMNYATTAIFQVIFAIRFGSGMNASVFVIASGLVLAIGSVVAASVQSLIVPRIVLDDGVLSRSALKLVLMFTIVAVVALTTVAAFPLVLAEPISRGTAIELHPLATALRVGALFMVFQTLASEAGAISLARGMRFTPAVAPAFPTIAGAMYLALEAHPSVRLTLLSMAVGAFAELAFLVFPLAKNARFAPGRPLQLRGISIWTAVQFGALTLMSPLERVFASIHGAGGAAEYNYALRSLTIAQQLLVGGLVLASLGDWSTIAVSHDRSAFKAAIWRSAGVAIALLVFAASIAIVAGRSLVHLVYQHGSFTASDTAAVTHLLFLALPGFCAEGIGLVLAQALLASRRNGVAVTLGFLNFGLRAAAVIAFGLRWGASGVAVAYSFGAVASLGTFAAVLVRLQPPGARSIALLRRAVFVAGGTAVTAAACVSVNLAGAGVRVVLTVAAFAGLSVAARVSLGGARWWTHA